MQYKLVYQLAAVFIIIDLMRLGPGMDRIDVTALNGCIPHSKSARRSFFGGFAQILLSIMSNSGFVDVAVITVPPVEQRNVSMTQKGLTNHIKAMICINQNNFSSSFYRQLNGRMGGHADLGEIRSFLQCHSETIGPHEKSCESGSDNASGDRLPVRMGHSPDREMHRLTQEVLSRSLFLLE